MSTLSTARRILLVDDHQGVLEAVTFRLHMRGYEVLTASDLPTALARIANDIFHMAIIDVCLVDRHFLNDTSGFAVTRALPATIPYIIYTAYPENDTTRKALWESGARAVIDKRSAVA